MKRVLTTETGGIVTEDITFFEYAEGRCEAVTGRNLAQWVDVFGARMVYDVRAGQLSEGSLFTVPGSVKVYRKYGLMAGEMDVLQVGVNGVELDDEETKLIELWDKRPTRSRKVITKFRGKTVEMRGQLDRVTRLRINTDIFNQTMKFYGSRT